MSMDSDIRVYTPDEKFTRRQKAAYGEVSC